MTTEDLEPQPDRPSASETPTPSLSVSSEMKIPINPHRAATLAANITSIRGRISSALSTTTSSKSSPPRNVRLVAVSKLKPASDILSLHTPPSAPPSPPISAQQHFGENYVQELLEKARLLPKSIKWHFIGGLQSNKCVQLAREVESLWAVESVDSEKKAGLLDKGRGERNERLKTQQGREGQVTTEIEPLRVFIQVNTSGEASKSGVDPSSPALASLARFIRTSCPHLHLQGLMTIGAIARSRATTAETENEDFLTLRSTRDKLAEELEMDKEQLELSMGMSEDFESAVRLGSGEVRVGSTIFGERPPKSEARVLENPAQGREVDETK